MSDFNAQIEKARKEGCNILLPASTEGSHLSEWHEQVAESVSLSPNPDDGDVYHHQKEKFIITRQGLMKLSVCAGIIWHPTECRRVDDRSDRNYVAYQAVAGIRKADGTPTFFKAEYDLDFEVIEEELRDGYEAKKRQWKKNGEWVDACVRRDLLFKRKHKLKLAESGAMCRVIRALLGLKNAYTANELKKPFVIGRIVLKVDYSDPKVKAQMASLAVNSIAGIYGNRGSLLPPPQMDIPDVGIGEDVIDVPPADDPPPHDEAPGPPPPTDEPPPPATGPVAPPLQFSRNIIEILELAPAQYMDKARGFAAMTEGDQIDELKGLIITKDYDDTKFPYPVDEFQEGNRLKLFLTLIQTPDPLPKPAPGPTDEDDIPF